MSAAADPQAYEDPISNVLKWVLLAVAIVSFGLLAWATEATYRLAPPQPERMVAADGTVLMTDQDIVDGKAGFQRADLMDYGSIYGMGSYFGEDYTAQYLVRLGQVTEENIAQARFGKTFAALDAADQAASRAAMQQQLKSVDLTAAEVRLPPELSGAVATLKTEIAALLLKHDFIKGWTQAYSLDQESAARTADFILYSALTTIARRPGTDVSWTQNWPYEPSVGNAPTTGTFGWTWASFCFTFFCFGLVLFFYHRYIRHEAGGAIDPVLARFQPLTNSQRKIGKYFIVVALVLLLQIAAGAILGHYYTDRVSFYGLHFDDVLPFNFWRSIHIQAPIIWIGLSWIGAGLFLAPAISGREAPAQGGLVDLLFWATVIIVAGALIGNYLGIMGYVGDDLWFWFGNQGLSYLELGRFWQIGFFLGLVFWSLLVMRGLWPTRESFRAATRQFWTGRIRLEHLIWASTTNIALLYVFGMVPPFHLNPSFTITDFWRWWVVHLWVEQSFEFFAASISAYLLMALGLVSRPLAERAVYLQLILIFLGGVLGTGHHIYWVGGPGMWVPLGSVFSFIEVLPLVLLILDAMDNYDAIKKQREFRYNAAYTFVLGSAFWNFVGAGVFGGGTLNAPLVNYYEHGTFLTLNHAHTSLFGAFGLLAIGLIYFCLRYAAGEREFNDKPALIAFWLYNAGLVLWIVLNFFPVGWPQLNAVYESGLAYARSLEFYETTILWQWMRFVGDIPFAAAALIMAFDFIVKLGPMFPQLAERLSARHRPHAAD